MWYNRIAYGIITKNSFGKKKVCIIICDDRFIHLNSDLMVKDLWFKHGGENRWRV
jgi:hypothetical protein